ncbi:hypothetical protein CEP53_000444 [Fusarium sp. AF-6]|nr:hypothetical protein CEP53_000444 [Fusarium sp. AF-6]
MDTNAEPPGRYDYASLGMSEIRIVTVLPGQFDDQVRLTMTHAKLEAPDRRPQPKMSLEELRQTLPAGWAVHETPHSKYIFESLRDPNKTSYTHPDRSIDPSLYEQPSDAEYWSFVPQYEALSYVWGKPGETRTVYFESDDGSSLTPHSIHVPLYEALKHLRRPDEPRRLWVDALCIDQTDHLEKPNQVRRMTLIFALASRVIAWLGPEFNDAGLALSTISNLGKQIVVTLAGGRITAPKAPELDWDVDKDKDMRVPRALANLMKCDLFERLWVVQELTLANRLTMLQCGKHTVPWKLFRRGISYLDMKLDLHDEELRRLVFLHRHWGQSHHGAPSEWVLREHKMKACSDPRDKIYGLLGVLPPKLASAIFPDYESPVEKTYQLALLTHIRLTERWEIFGCDLVERQVGGPSWVPDLLSPYSNAWNSRRQFAGGYSRIQAVHRDESPDLLEVMGVHCATVSSVTSDVPDDTTKALQLARSWEPDDLYTAGYPTGETLLEAYASLFLQHTFKDRWPIILFIRPVDESKRQFRLIGDGFVYGLSDAIGILGPFPKPWRAQGFSSPEIDLRCTYKFFNADTGEVTLEDPRLGPLPEEWERADLEIKEVAR